ncbi:hypothetical protein GFS24_10290 [Chitinophaga sp. SYP-B3965]|uniref:hypothetical protein n=1 Tax=Chitinophaga sp. SYP-B3965 TaxID=2663120 RepID=UPI001299A1D7|nr:hypothetical protein [Chitinophaga sp. SYP-B3965]MRG45506.1 hypothetical protein [Chitinophaga sp. SYP-B3965]
MAQLQNELAEKEMIKKFRHEGTWLEEVPAKQRWVSNDIIKIPREGSDPAVLINNKIYPIISNRREDDFVAVALNKYDTTNTEVSDDELASLPYEKVSEVQLQHRATLEEKTTGHALYCIAPNENTADTPVVETTGGDDGYGRKRLTTEDIINFGTKIKKKTGGTLQGVVLVLSPEHIADLLIEDLSFRNQFHNKKDGLIATNYYGFKTYETGYSPAYDIAGKKLAYDSVTPGREATVCFYNKSVAKAKGTVKRYARDAENDPENRKNTIGFRLWFIGIPYRPEGQGAIISGKV